MVSLKSITSLMHFIRSNDNIKTEEPPDSSVFLLLEYLTYAISPLLAKC